MKHFFCKIFNIVKLGTGKIAFKAFPIFFLFIINTFNAFSSHVFIQAKLDTDKILIGDQIHFTIIVEQPADQKVIFPLLKDTLTGKIQIISALPFDTIKASPENIRITSKYLITCFDSGNYIIPSLPFVMPNDKQTDTLHTLPLSLFVHGIKVEKGKFYDIKGLMTIPITLKEIIMFILIALAIYFIICLIIYIILRRKDKKPLFKIEKPLEPAHIIAFRELEVLKAEKLWQKGMIKQYYTKLTDIVRKYLEHRFNILAMESTSDEIFDSIKDIKIIESQAQGYLENLLRLADFVKFAKAQPLPDENENSWNNAYNFVLDTKFILKTEEITEPVKFDENIVSEVKTE
jgi:hypothetical protein